MQFAAKNQLSAKTDRHTTGPPIISGSATRPPQPSTPLLLLHRHTTIPVMTMARPTSHSQYFSRKPSSCISCCCGAMVTGGLDSSVETAGGSGSTMGGSAITGAGGIGGGLRLAILFLAFGTICWGAGSATNVVCSATAAGAGAAIAPASASGCGAAGSWADASTGGGAAAGTASGLVAQADKANAEINRTTGNVALSVLDMAFPPNGCGPKSGWNLPTDTMVGQTSVSTWHIKDLIERSQNPGRIKL